MRNNMQQEVQDLHVAAVPLPELLVDEGPEVRRAEVPRAGGEAHQPASLLPPVCQRTVSHILVKESTAFKVHTLVFCDTYQLLAYVHQKCLFAKEETWRRRT